MYNVAGGEKKIPNDFSPGLGVRISGMIRVRVDVGVRVRVSNLLG